MAIRCTEGTLHEVRTNARPQVRARSGKRPWRCGPGAPGANRVGTIGAAHRQSRL